MTTESSCSSCASTNKSSTTSPESKEDPAIEQIFSHLETRLESLKNEQQASLLDIRQGLKKLFEELVAKKRAEALQTNPESSLYFDGYTQIFPPLSALPASSSLPSTVRSDSPIIVKLPPSIVEREVVSEDTEEECAGSDDSSDSEEEEFDPNLARLQIALLRAKLKLVRLELARAKNVAREKEGNARKCVAIGAQVSYLESIE
ncbi:hypothetical protein JCM3765_004160 [Sporobolomyces pararoseus]